MEIKSILNDIIEGYKPEDLEVRECPQCGHESIIGMPGGVDSTCKNCGYKDPCCSDY